MTRKLLALALATTALGGLAACSHPTVVQTKDGQQIVAPDEPQYDKKSGTYQYEDNGRKVQINKDDVHSMEEVK
ncbi:YgdI/YgdR family lipoprotein [Bordetella genomosp. 10]|uniref:YgdI/YgdR family lipoprotein n=1 Tax=Bordetella genomosp. 10 TaxID=1416804 RepID=A0A261SAX2_9BORD|nr:YgdI/YgdR family lipoprotein [Bordetella genomosp. 10]OZI33920.1 YgdI/YgdR family lipoprotein [Bordetella genomosp. 10]